MSMLRTLSVTSNRACSEGILCVIIIIVQIKLFHSSVLRLLVTGNVVRSSLILVSLMMEAIRFFEISVFTRATRRQLQEKAFFLFPFVIGFKPRSFAWLRYINILNV
jgi:hypothetical protein